MNDRFCPCRIICFLVAIAACTDSAGDPMCDYTLLSPANNATNVSLTPTLDWTDAPGATSYQVIVIEKPNGLFVVDIEVPTSQYSIPAGVLSQSRPYSWHITSWNACGNLVHTGYFSTGPPCQLSISPQSQSFSGDGGTATANVTTTQNCYWNAFTRDKFIKIKSNLYGNKGSGTVSYSVAQSNTDQEGTLEIVDTYTGGKTAVLTITQTAGLPEISDYPSQLEFGQLDVGTFKDLSFSISNTGKGPLTIFSFDFPNNDLRVSPSPPLTIADGKQVSFKAQFVPSSLGNQNKILTVRSNDGDEGSVEIVLTAVVIAGKFGFVRSVTSKSTQATFKTNASQWTDINKDGRLDFYLTGVSGNALFTNKGKNKFLKNTKNPVGNVERNSSGAAWADVDNDGDLDVFIANVDNQAVVLENRAGSFFDAGGAFGSVDTTDSVGGIWFELNNDGKIDLLIIKDGQSNQLFKNIGNFKFQLVSSPNLDSGPVRSAAAADINNDGYDDLYLVFDHRRNHLYINKKNESFGSVTGAAFWGVGRQANFVDYDNDADLDIFVANGNGRSVLYENTGNLRFRDVTTIAGLSVPRKAQSATFADFDLDGSLDVVIVESSGKVSLFANNGAGKFGKVTNIHLSHAAKPTTVISGDFDNDGRIDLLIGNSDPSGSGYLLYRNVGASNNNWVGLRLNGKFGNRAGIGAKISHISGNTVQTRVVSGGTGRNQDSLPMIFGLGTLSSGVFQIDWSGGSQQLLQSVSANQTLTVEETRTVGPIINRVSPLPAVGKENDIVVLFGANFGKVQGGSKVFFGEMEAPVESWEEEQISIRVPKGVTTSDIYVFVGGKNSNPIEFVVLPNEGNLSPISGASGGGTRVTILSPSKLEDTEFSILFGSNLAREIRFIPPDIITCDSPPGTGTVDVQISLTTVSMNVGSFTYK